MQCILNSKQLYDFAVKEIIGMSFGHVTIEEYEDEAKFLKARFAQSIRIVGTQKLHYIKPISKSFVIVKDYSSSLIGNKRCEPKESKNTCCIYMLVVFQIFDLIKILIMNENVGA